MRCLHKQAIMSLYTLPRLLIDDASGSQGFWRSECLDLLSLLSELHSDTSEAVGLERLEIPRHSRLDNVSLILPLMFDCAATSWWTPLSNVFFTSDLKGRCESYEDNVNKNKFSTSNFCLTVLELKNSIFFLIGTGEGKAPFNLSSKRAISSMPSSLSVSVMFKSFAESFSVKDISLKKLLPRSSCEPILGSHESIPVLIVRELASLKVLLAFPLSAIELISSIGELTEASTLFSVSCWRGRRRLRFFEKSMTA